MVECLLICVRHGVQSPVMQMKKTNQGLSHVGGQDVSRGETQEHVTSFALSEQTREPSQKDILS